MKFIFRLWKREKEKRRKKLRYQKNWEEESKSYIPTSDRLISCERAKK